MVSQPYGLLIGALCVWRVTHLLQAEDGPFDAVVVAEPWRERLLLWPALSAVAILLERATTPRPPPALYVEDPPEEGTHVVLRSEGGAVEPGPTGPPAS